jgi:hypothetical protein
MKRFVVKIDRHALNDIQDIANWYNEQQKGLGKKFLKTTIQHINSLSKDPHIYAIRYNEIRCIPIKRFPYMAHFHINEKNNFVEVLGVISTDRNPKVWEEKTSRS